MPSSASNPKTIFELSKRIQDGSLDPVQFIESVFDEVDHIDRSFNVMNATCKDLALAQAKSLKSSKSIKSLQLAGVPVSVKDCVCVQGVESRSGSAILNGYRPLFDATAVSKLKAQGAIIIGKTSQDEFGFGSFSVNVGKGFKVPKNPIDPQRVTGGSSGGAAALTKKLSIPHIAISESTGGSIVCPAALCGVAGFCPTYSRVSRWGLIDYANSLDKIGAMARTIDEAAFALELMSGLDDQDSTSTDHKEKVFIPNTSIKGMKIGILDDTFTKGVSIEVQEAIQAQADLLEKHGAIVERIALPKTSKFSIPAYYVIATAETSTNLAKFSGLRYGASNSLDHHFNEYFAKVRSENFGDEAKRRILLGTFARMAGFRDAFYMRAATVRQAIINEYKAMFGKVDVILSPAMPSPAPKFVDVAKLTPLQNYTMDLFQVGPNLAGLPNATVPIKSKSPLPIGLMAIGDHFQEAKVLAVLREAELK